MEDIAPGLITFCIILGITIAIFLAIRAIVLWYWKIDAIVENQQKQIHLLKQLIDSIRNANAPSVDSKTHATQPSHSLKK